MMFTAGCCVYRTMLGILNFLKSNLCFGWGHCNIHFGILCLQNKKKTSFSAGELLCIIRTEKVCACRLGVRCMIPLISGVIRDLIGWGGAREGWIKWEVYVFPCFHPLLLCISHHKKGDCCMKLYIPCCCFTNTGFLCFYVRPSGLTLKNNWAQNMYAFFVISLHAKCHDFSKTSLWK